MNKTQCDILVVGCGAVGAAVARSLASSRKGASVVVLEKEEGPALHTSGRNSGVLHSGFNPEPGTLKARFCVEGNARAREFCLKHKVALQTTGTIVVAQNLIEAETLAELLRRGRENNVPGIQMLSPDQMREKEPYAEGKTALFSPTGSIVDSAGFVQAMVAEAEELGAKFVFREKVKRFTALSAGFEVQTSGGAKYIANVLFNCAGLHADTLAHQLGAGMEYSIFPFRGQYYRTSEEKKHVLKSMVYPAPDLRYPFLGVHWTRTVGGEVLAGPNAVIAMGRESYSPFKINLAETAKMILDHRTWKMMASKDFRHMASTQFWISFSKNRFAQEAAKLIPGITPDDLEVYPKAGNRPQLINKDGHMVEDLVVEKRGNSLHVLNAVSPGLTSSLAFADHLVSQL